MCKTNNRLSVETQQLQISYLSGKKYKHIVQQSQFLCFYKHTITRDTWNCLPKDHSIILMGETNIHHRRNERKIFNERRLLPNILCYCRNPTSLFFRKTDPFSTETVQPTELNDSHPKIACFHLENDHGWMVLNNKTRTARDTPLFLHHIDSIFEPCSS